MAERTTLRRVIGLFPRGTPLGLVSLCAFALLTAGSLKAQGTTPPADLVEIRELDLLVRTDGEEILCTILSADPEAAQLQIKVRTVRTTIDRNDIARIVPHQDAEQAYANWADWLRKQARPGGTVAGARERALAELELARWCLAPHPKLAGEAPKPDAGLAHLETAVRADPELVDAYPLLLSEYVRAHPIESATIEELDAEVETYLAAEAVGHRSVDIDFRLAAILDLRLGQPELARARYERVVAADGGGNRAQLRQSRERLERLLVDEGSFAAAVDLWTAALSPDPAAAENFEPLYRLGRLRLAQGDAAGLEAARERFGAARALQPDYPDLLLDLAALEVAAGRLKEASLHLRAFVEARPDDARGQLDLALVDIEKGEFSRAEKALKKVLTASPDAGTEGRARRALASIHELRGRFDEALAEYRSALAVTPDSVESQLAFALAALRAGQIDEARRTAEAVLSARGGDRAVFGAASRILALVDIRRGNLEAAGARLEFAADVASGDAGVLEKAGLVFLRLGKLEQGSRYLTRAQALEADRAATLAGLGYQQYELGAMSEAAGLFRRAAAAIRPESGRGLDSIVAGAVREYTKEALSVIEDVETLQVSVDRFASSDASRIDGWTEVELYGVEVRPGEEGVIFAGEQSKTPDGETGLRLIRPISATDLERVSVTLKVDEGSPRVGLQLSRPEGSASSLAAIALERDVEGRVRVRTRTSQGQWKEPDVVSEVEPGAPAKEWYPGDRRWPDDGGLHTLEIRRTSGPAREKRSDVFDLWFDGEVVARNIQATGLGSKSFEAAIWASTDALGKRYKVSLDSFRVYRVAPGATRRTER